MKLLSFELGNRNGKPIAICTAKWADAEISVERTLEFSDLRALSWEAHAEMIHEVKRLRLLSDKTQVNA